MKHMLNEWLKLGEKMQVAVWKKSFETRAIV